MASDICHMSVNHQSPFAVIFDMDGVLIDSVSLNWEAYNQVLEQQYGVRVHPTDLSNYIGRTLDAQIFLLDQHFHINIDPGKFRHDTEIIKQQLFANIQPKPGVVRLLEALTSNKIPRAVGTSMSLATTSQRLHAAGLWHYFDIYITEEAVRYHKPHPDTFQKAADMLHMPYATCVVFEDTPVGVEAAKTGGMKCCAIETSYVNRDFLTAADVIYDSLENVDLPKLQHLFER